jgi:phage FluMu protein Com
MSMLKSGVSYSKLIVSKMVFACKSCDHVEIISEKDYSPDIERKCPKCQNIMVLKSSNTNTIKFPIDDVPNMDGDYFDKTTKE